MNYLLGTDIGTSGTKTILMDTDGNLIAQDLQEYDVLTPKPLWAEQWPSVWLDAAKASIKNTVLKSGIPLRIYVGLLSAAFTVALASHWMRIWSLSDLV